MAEPVFFTQLWKYFEKILPFLFIGLPFDCFWIIYCIYDVIIKSALCSVFSLVVGRSLAKGLLKNKTPKGSVCISFEIIGGLNSETRNAFEGKQRVDFWCASNAPFASLKLILVEKCE